MATEVSHEMTPRREAAAKAVIDVPREPVQRMAIRLTIIDVKEADRGLSLAVAGE